MSVQRNLGQLLTTIMASLVSGSIGIMASISYVALIYGGNRPEYVGIGLGIALFSSFVLQCGVSRLSSFPSTVADIGALPVTILALSAVEIREQMVNASEEAIFITIMATVALTSLMTGLFFLTLGRLKVGGLIRFIPYPVVGGFLAGMGWLLMAGSIQVLTGFAMRWSLLPQFFTFQSLALSGTGIGMAIALWLICRRFQQIFVFPCTLISFIVLFYGGLGMTHTTIAQAQAQGWLLNSIPTAGKLWEPALVAEIVTADWQVVLAQLPRISTILPISALAILLSISSLSLVSDQDLDINRELEVVGLANCLSGLGGGMTGYHIISDSLLAYKMGARNRLVGLFNGLLCLAVLLWGVHLLTYCPKPILGGLLFFIGIDTLWEWVIDKRRQLPKADYVIVVLITVVIATVGFLEGVIVGLILAVVLFVVNYSRIDVVRTILSGQTLRSNVQRSPLQEALLKDQGDRILILRLQGFLVLGTADHMVEQIRQQIALRQRLTPENPLMAVILDFHFVNGIDSSATLSFVQLEQLARKQAIALIFTDITLPITQALHQGGCFQKQDTENSRLFTTLEQGLAWGEALLLKDVSQSVEIIPDLAAQLQDLFPSSEALQQFMGYLELMIVEPGEVVCRQGEPSDGLYFLESGQVSISLRLPHHIRKRLRTFHSGTLVTIVGEMGLYGEAPRSASVIVDLPSRLYFLSNKAFQKLETDHPSLAMTVHKLIVQQVAQRILYREEALQNLTQ